MEPHPCSNIDHRPVDKMGVRHGRLADQQHHYFLVSILIIIKITISSSDHYHIVNVMIFYIKMSKPASSGAKTCLFGVCPRSPVPVKNKTKIKHGFELNFNSISFPLKIIANSYHPATTTRIPHILPIGENTFLQIFLVYL